MPLNLKAEEADEEKCHHGNRKTGHKASTKHDNLLGTGLTFIERIVNEFSFVGSGCQRNAVLFAFLQ